METITITYTFLFPDKVEKSYTIQFDKEKLSLSPAENAKYPDWAKLDHHKCAHCPLNSKDHPYCPVASNLSQLVESFEDKASYSEAFVQVRTKEREYHKKIRLQEGIFSAFGLIMPLSDCPHTHFLKPMARFHLPFSSPQETIVRSVSLYLLKQYFVEKRGGQPDRTLNQLESHYDGIKKVNLGVINRIRGMAHSDADVNAVIILHSFADLLTLAISNDLSSLEPLFFPEDA